MADEINTAGGAPPATETGRNWGALIGAAIVGLIIGAVAVRLIWVGPANTKLTTAREQVGAYADSNATARVAADSARAALATTEAERDSFKAWYAEAVEMLQSTTAGSAPAPTAPAATAETAEDWESLGR